MISHKNRPQNYYGLVIAVGVVILGVFSYLFWSMPQEIVARMAMFIPVLTMVVLAISCMITLISFKYQSDDRARMMGVQYANLNQSKTTDIDKLFLTNPMLDRLYYEMYSHDPNIQHIQTLLANQHFPNKISANTLNWSEFPKKGAMGEEMAGGRSSVLLPAVPQLKAEHQAANLIFQKIADVYACEKLVLNQSDSIEWFNMFRSWMQSPILRSHWRYLKYEQHPEVRDFVDEYLIKRNRFITKNN